MLYLINQQNEYKAVYGSEIWEKTLAGEKLSDSIKDLVLAKIAQVKVMNLMAVDYGIELTPEENEAIKERNALLHTSRIIPNISLRTKRIR